MEIVRPLSSICKGTGTWSGGVRRSPLPLPNEDHCSEQNHECPDKETLKLPALGTTCKSIPKTFATRHGALLLFSDTYDIWRRQLKEKGGNNENDEEEVADVVEQLKTLKELRKLVLSFGLDDESVIKGISAILHDQSFVPVRPDFSAICYTSRAVRLWDPKLVDKYLENDGINKSVVQRYFELLLPDVSVNGVVLKDTLLGSKPQHYKPCKLPSIRMEGRGRVTTNEMMDGYITEARKKAVMVLPKIDFIDSCKSKPDHGGSVQMDKMKKKLVDPNQNKFWNNYENLSYMEKADLLLRMLVSRTNNISKVIDDSENLDKEQDSDRKYIFPEMKKESVPPPVVNDVPCKQKDRHGAKPLPPICNTKSILKTRDTKDVHKVTENQTTQPLQILPDEIQSPLRKDQPKFAYKPTKLTAHGISYSDQSLRLNKKHDNSLLIQGTSLTKCDDNFPSTGTAGTNGRPVSLPLSFTTFSNNEDLMQKYIHTSRQYNRTNLRSVSAQHDNSRASYINISGLHNKLHESESESRLQSNILSTNYFPRAAESTTSSSLDGMDGPVADDLHADDRWFENSSLSLSNEYSDGGTSCLLDIKTDPLPQSTTKEINHNLTDSSLMKKNENYYINSETVKEADDNSIKTGDRAESSLESDTSISQEDLNNSDQSSKFPIIIVTHNVGLDTGKESDAIKNIVLKDTSDTSDTSALHGNVTSIQSKEVINDNMRSISPIAITHDDVQTIPSVVPPDHGTQFSHSAVNDFIPSTQPNSITNEDHPSFTPVGSLFEKSKCTSATHTSPSVPFNKMNTSIDHSPSDGSCVQEDEIHDVQLQSPPLCYEGTVHETPTCNGDNEVESIELDTETIIDKEDGDNNRNADVTLTVLCEDDAHDDNLPRNIEKTKDEFVDNISLEDINRNDVLHVERDSSITQDVLGMGERNCDEYIEDESEPVVDVRVDNKPDQISVGNTNHVASDDIKAEAPNAFSGHANISSDISIPVNERSPVTLIGEVLITDVHEYEVNGNIFHTDKMDASEGEECRNEDDVDLSKDTSAPEEDIQITDCNNCVEGDSIQEHLNVIIHQVLSRPGSGVDLQKDLNTATQVYKTIISKEHADLITLPKVDEQEGSPENVKANNTSNKEDVNKQENHKVVENHAELSTGLGVKGNVTDSMGLGVKGNVADSTGLGVKGNVTDSTGLGVKFNVADSTGLGVKGNVTDSTGLGVKGNVTDSTGLGAKGNVTDSTGLGVKGNVTDSTGLGVKGNVTDSVELRKSVELGTNESVLEEKVLEEKEKESASINPDPFRVGTALEEKPVFLDDTPKKSNKKLPQVKKKTKDQKNIDTKSSRNKFPLLQEQSLDKTNALTDQRRNLRADMKPHTPSKSGDSNSSSARMKISVETLDEKVVDGKDISAENDYENQKQTLLAKKMQRDKSASEKRAEVERKRNLLQEKRRLEKEEKLRETEAYILKAQEEDRRNEELQKEMEEDLKRQEEERKREQEMEKKRLEDEEVQKRTKEGEAERLKRKKIAEEEAQRKKMEILMAERQMELDFKRTQEEMTRAIEADMAEKEKILMEQMAEEERRQYEENKKLEEELQRKEDAERVQLLEIKRKNEEERRERELEELLRIETKQLFASSARRSNRYLELKQQMSRAYTYSYLTLLPVIFLGSHLSSPKKSARKM